MALATKTLQEVSERMAALSASVKELEEVLSALYALSLSLYIYIERERLSVCVYIYTYIHTHIQM